MSFQIDTKVLDKVRFTHNEQKRIIDESIKNTGRELSYTETVLMILLKSNLSHGILRRSVRISLKRAMMILFKENLTAEGATREDYLAEGGYRKIEKNCRSAFILGDRTYRDPTYNLNNILPENPMNYFREDERKLRSLRDAIEFISPNAPSLTPSPEVREFFYSLYRKLQK